MGENGIIEFKYLNEKRLCVNDFMKSIKRDLTHTISKNLGFIDEKNEVIYFEILFTDKNGEEEIFDFSDNIKKFNADDICVDDFTKDLLDFINEMNYLCDGIYYSGDDVVDFRYDHYNINNFIIDSFNVTIYSNADKILHKKKFYKDLYDDLMFVAWNPSRYLEWCVDIDELKFLKELWGED